MTVPLPPSCAILPAAFVALCAERPVKGSPWAIFSAILLKGQKCAGSVTARMPSSCRRLAPCITNCLTVSFGRVGSSYPATGPANAVPGEASDKEQLRARASAITFRMSAYPSNDHADHRYLILHGR